MVNRAETRAAASPPPEIPRDKFEAAYNMVNPCVFRQGRSLCSLKREIQTLRAASPLRMKLPRCGAAPGRGSRKRRGWRTRPAVQCGRPF